MVRVQLSMDSTAQDFAKRPEEPGGGGGGLGSAVAETRLRFVAMITCGTVIGPVCVMAI